MSENKDVLPTNMGKELTSIPEWYEVNPNYRLRILPLEHDLRLLPNQYGTLKEGIGSSDASIFEYFRPDWGDSGNWAITGLFTVDGLPWFDEAGKIAASLNKDILNFDPAHGPPWAVIKGTEASLMVGGLSLALSAGLDRFKTRRDFLFSGAKVAAGVFLAATGFIPQLSLGKEQGSAEDTGIPNESYFRMAVVAGLIELMGKNLAALGKSETHTLIYPPFHIIRILRNLRLPEERNIILNNSAFFKLIPNLREAYFVGRRRRFENNTWKQVNTVSLA